MRTMADQSKIAERVFVAHSQGSTQLQNAVIGLCGDVGEFASCVQRWLEYGKELDRTNAIEELGDCLWRIAQACDALKWDMEEVMEANIRKLAKRYPERYSDEQAAEERRNRIAEREAIEQTGSGWAEPPDESLVEVAAVEAAKVPVSFGDGLARPDTSSYSRVCIVCNRVKIHRTNSIGICPQCVADKKAAELESEEGEY